MEPNIGLQLMERLEMLEGQVRLLARRVQKLEAGEGAIQEGKPRLGNENRESREAGSPPAPTPAPAPVKTEPFQTPVITPPPPPVRPPAMPSPEPARWSHAARVEDAAAAAEEAPAAALRTPLPAMEPPPPAEESEFWKLLDSLGLVPPKAEEGNIEIQIGTWWATRIGTILAVIAVVFFGVYVAQFSKPWIRFVELLGASIGVTGFGLWMERRYPKYGSVVFGGGLALLYFCAFASTEFPAVRIMTDKNAGAMLQMLAAAGIVACALWRNSPAIASMAVLCGFVSCFFSSYAGLTNTALTAGLVLSGVAVYFYQARGWTNAFGLSVPLAYILYAADFQGWLRGKPGPPPFWACEGYLLAYLGAFATADMLALERGRMMEATARQFLQLFNSIAAVALGFFVARTMFPADMAAYYFVFGAGLTALAVRYWVEGHPDVLMHGYFVKGSALVTLGLITALGGRSRWVALLGESFVLLASARRSGLPIVRVAMVLVWLASWAFFMLHTMGMFARGASSFEWKWISGIWSAVYVAGSTVLLGLHGRLYSFKEEAGTRDPNPGLGAFMSLLLGAAILAFCFEYLPCEFEGVYFALAWVAIWAIGVRINHWIPFAALILPISLTYLRFWNPFDSTFEHPWINGVTLTGLMIGAAVWVDRRWPAARPGGIGKNENPVESQLAVLAACQAAWLITLQAIFARAFDNTGYLFMSVVTTAGLAALAARRNPVRLLGDCAPVLMVLAVARLAILAADGLIFERDSGSWAQDLLLWIAAPLAWAIAWAYSQWDDLVNRLGPLRDTRAHAWIPAVAAWAAGGLIMGGAMTLHPDMNQLSGWVIPDGASMVLFALAAVAVAALTRTGMKNGIFFGLAYLVVAHLVFYNLAYERGKDADMGFLLISLGVGAVGIGLALIGRKLRPDLKRESQLTLQWTMGWSALVLCLWLFAVQGGALKNYITVFWGMSSVAIFLAGLGGRMKPLRIVGLAGLALCIPRVFLVDVRSTFYRIVATGVLGAVVLAVAFLYTKNRAAIEKWDAEG